jgi:hypothetical protein
MKLVKQNIDIKNKKLKIKAFGKCMVHQPKYMHVKSYKNLGVQKLYKLMEDNS